MLGYFPTHLICHQQLPEGETKFDGLAYFCQPNWTKNGKAFSKAFMLLWTFLLIVRLHWPLSLPNGARAPTLGKLKMFFPLSRFFRKSTIYRKLCHQNVIALVWKTRWKCFLLVLLHFSSISTFHESLILAFDKFSKIYWISASLRRMKSFDAEEKVFVFFFASTPTRFKWKFNLYLINSSLRKLAVNGSQKRNWIWSEAVRPWIFFFT